MKLIKIERIIALLLFSLAITGSAMAAQVVFLDDFESYTTGVPLPAGSPPIGFQWFDYLSPSNDTVSTAEAASGTKSLHMVRDLISSSHVAALSTTTNALVNGQDIMIQQDVYIPSAADSCENYYIAPPRGGWQFDGSQIKVLDSGGWVATGISPDLGQWNTHYAVLHMVDSGGLTWGGTYDMYLKKADGSIVVLAKDLALVDVFIGDSIARLHLYAGYASEVYYDNIIMTGNYVAECGDVIHPNFDEDLSGDCKVDFFDFAMLAANWMVCTPIACP